MLGGTSPCADCRDLLAVEGAASRLARDPPAGAEHRAAFGGPREAGTKPGTRTPRWTRRRMRVHPPQRRGREATTMRLYLHAVTAASPPLFRCRQRRRATSCSCHRRRRRRSLRHGGVSTPPRQGRLGGRVDDVSPAQQHRRDFSKSSVKISKKLPSVVCPRWRGRLYGRPHGAPHAHCSHGKCVVHGVLASSPRLRRLGGGKGARTARGVGSGSGDVGQWEVFAGGV